MPYISVSVVASLEQPDQGEAHICVPELCYVWRGVCSTANFASSSGRFSPSQSEFDLICSSIICFGNMFFLQSSAPSIPFVSSSCTCSSVIALYRCCVVALCASLLFGLSTPFFLSFGEVRLLLVERGRWEGVRLCVHEVDPVDRLMHIPRHPTSLCFALARPDYLFLHSAYYTIFCSCYDLALSSIFPLFDRSGFQCC